MDDQPGNDTVLCSSIEALEEYFYDNCTKFNLTLDEYLLLVRGAKRLPLNIVIPITLVYVLIFVTGIIGNVSVCVVIIRNTSMHTATNYYLFSLAVSDLTILLLGLPNDLNVYWQQYPWVLGEALCKFRALVSEMTSYTSVLTIVAFSMERYLAICHPLHSYTMSGLRRALRIIAVLWIISLMSAVPFAVFTTINYVDYPPGSGNIVHDSAFCAMLNENLPPNWPIYEVSSFVFFILPMGIIVILYVRMGLRIRETNYFGKKMEGTVHGETKQSHSRKAIIRMLTSVVVAFFLCWAPFHAQRLLYVYAKDSPNYLEINAWMYYITGCFYYFSSTVNPILYNIMSAKYRVAFKETLCGTSVGFTSNMSREASSVRDSSHWVRTRSVNERANSFIYKQVDRNGAGRHYSAPESPQALKNSWSLTYEQNYLRDRYWRQNSVGCENLSKEARNSHELDDLEPDESVILELFDHRVHREPLIPRHKLEANRCEVKNCKKTTTPSTAIVVMSSANGRAKSISARNGSVPLSKDDSRQSFKVSPSGTAVNCLVSPSAHSNNSRCSSVTTVSNLTSSKLASDSNNVPPNPCCVGVIDSGDDDDDDDTAYSSETDALTSAPNNITICREQKLSPGHTETRV